LVPFRKCSLAALAAAAALSAWATDAAYFIPSHLLPGIGISRQESSAETLVRRTDAMIQSQTFSIMREPQAAQGAERIYSSGLQRLFREAERKSGFPATVLEAIAYLESWGVANAESPAGPRGIMQISEATGRRMGLRIAYAKRRRVIKTRVAVRNKHGKLVYRTVKHRETYTVLARDERLNPQKAVPAAAEYLAGMERRYGGRDWAIWAYHCGEGCVADFMALARGAWGATDRPPSVAQVFFGCSPVWHRELCSALRAQMDRDYSPTYWFRVMRAEQLLSMYQDDPAEFRDLVEEYRNPAAGAVRAPDRLSVWLKPQDLIYETGDRIRSEDESKLASAPDDPGFYGYRLDAQMAAPDAGQTASWRLRAFPSTIGTLAYIAFETRRLFEAMAPGVQFVPLDVTALVLPKDEISGGNGGPGGRMTEHSSGQVFDVSMSGLPGGERECLQFVLDDLGWYGHLGFVEESPGGQTMHIGCAPTSREFFARVFDDALAALRERSVPPVVVPAGAPAAPPLPPIFVIPPVPPPVAH
jgi:soluble lytic murein transglycosylase-like protein